MEVLGVAIVISTILFLIDKNGQWSHFWRLAKRVAIGLIAIAILISAGFYFYRRHENARLASAWTPVADPSIAAPASPSMDYDLMAQQNGGTTVYTLKALAAKHDALLLPPGSTLAPLSESSPKMWGITIEQDNYYFRDRSHAEEFVRAAGLVHAVH
ncbi:MAG TPA: hypothetical protein VNW97_03675 [Candidatus Saccharimonadales bacterium]|nr:hypothetical protein [Candidatus Saccharimonadales bacterium]